MFTLRDAVYVIELAIYCPIIPAVVFIAVIHGGKKPYTWRPVVIPLLLMSGLRIAGAALGLKAMNPDASALLNTATVLDTVGLAPALCLLIGLLIRANAPLYKGLPLWVFIPLQMVAVTGTVMTAYGGRDLYSSGQNAAQDLRLMRTGLFLFVATFGVSVGLAAATLLKSRDKCYRTEWATAVCALLSVPFMTVRLTFSAVSLFSGRDSVLSPLNNNDTAIWLHLFMVILMEYVLTLGACSIGLLARQVVTIVADKDDLLSEEEL